MNLQAGEYVSPQPFLLPNLHIRDHRANNLGVGDSQYQHIVIRNNDDSKSRENRRKKRTQSKAKNNVNNSKILIPHKTNPSD
jgi:hypothetical protein